MVATTAIFADWQPATHCTAGPAVGAKAMLAWCLDVFDNFGVHSDGIFNCRDVRGGGTWSIHAEGRAVDVGFPLVRNKSGLWVANPAGTALVQIIRPLAVKVGVQCLIWNRRIWSNKSPGMEGRDYEGIDPHTGHVHIELTRKAAANLNLKTIRHWLGADDVDDLSDVLKPTRKPAATNKPPAFGPIAWEQPNNTAKPGARTLHRGSRGKDVAWVQGKLGKRAGKADGWYGHQTYQAVRQYQAAREMAVTGRVGEPTWKKLLAA